VDRLDNLIREMAANWEFLEPREHPRVDPAERARFVGAWNEHRQIYGYTLLAELPFALRQALHDHPALEGVDYDLLIVDEYQDLNACDLEVLHLIAERGCSIIAAGDDDQSIYSFRYAAPEGIRRFPDDYPGCSIYPLSVTQRCGRRIIEWATHVIAGDPDRPRDRPALRCADGSPDGEVALLVFPGEITEAQGIAALIQQLVDRDQVPAEEILVLLRGDHNGTFSGPVKRALDDLGIAYSDPDAVERMLAEPDNRRMLATFRLLVHERDSLAWASLLLLTPGIGQTFCDYIYERARVARVQFGEALFVAYEANFPDAPRSANRARTLMQVVTAWLTAHPAPDEMPEEGWGHWMVGTAGDDVVPEPSVACIELLHALDGLMEESPLAVDAPDYLSGHDAREGFEEVRPGDVPRQGLDRFMSQITPLGKDRALAESHGVRTMTIVGSLRGSRYERQLSRASTKALCLGLTQISGRNADCCMLP
jgi:DNA helicase-2/ATP-dependent DNA helicase PcrA